MPTTQLFDQPFKRCDAGARFRMQRQSAIDIGMQGFDLAGGDVRAAHVIDRGPDKANIALKRIDGAAKQWEAVGPDADRGDLGTHRCQLGAQFASRFGQFGAQLRTQCRQLGAQDAAELVFRHGADIAPQRTAYNRARARQIEREGA